MLPTLAEIESAEQGIREYFATPLTVVKRAALPPMPEPIELLYAIREFRADGGRGFRFDKRGRFGDLAATAYDVFLADPALADAGIAFDSCDCKGFQRHGHCKHRDAAQDIADRTLPTCGKPAKPMRMCSQCGRRPVQCGGYLCAECEGRM